MSLFAGLREALDPHVRLLQGTANIHMQALNNRLQQIEKAVNDLGRGDIGSNWQRFQIRKKFEAAETVEIGTCPMNEIWLIQCIASDGVQEKSPAFVFEANGVLIQSVIKEGLGFEGIGGNQAVMPGEVLNLTTRAGGSINCSITIIRRITPDKPILADMGRDSEKFSRRNVHEIERDVIGQRLATVYHESPGEVVPSTGRREGNAH